MIEQPHLDSYSVPARVCLGIAVFGGTLLIAVMLATGFVM